MSQTQLHDQLAQLQDALSSTSDLSPETKRLLGQLEQQIHERIESSDSGNSLADTATLLETRFASEHPVAEALMRNIIDSLAKMGI